ncbi:hypothetical protein ASD04_09345 [Devosia sp. Root436]|jgi:hypothetical protein|uniref:hypothetical protein n=1 Tax=Devosia sp. Root436 TaxID=1736537 RepID=UPI000701CAB9|nr:hypothetical protein [Devosia sp. Root436]KQX38844.1 hypothetical protein ASD04_09345 [Devosia sp. Root436]
MDHRLLGAAVAALTILSPLPAFAMKGIDAARSCEARPGCKVIYDNSGGEVIVIVVDGSTIVCPTPQSECEVWTRVGGTRLPHADLDAVLADPGRSSGSGKPSVAPRPGGLTITR